MLRASRITHSPILFLEDFENLDNMLPFKTPTAYRGKERNRQMVLPRTISAASLGRAALSVATKIEIRSLIALTIHLLFTYH